MNKFGSKTFKLILVLVFGLFVVGLLIINSNSVKNAAIPFEDLPAGVRQSNINIQGSGNGGVVKDVKCEGYGYCYDRNVTCGDGTTCTMIAKCHKTVGCAFSDCCAGHGGYK